MEINFNPTEKQSIILQELLDGDKTELVFGGGNGGGKSFIGCAWLVIQCLQYKGIRCLIGRSKLTTLKSSTLNSLFDVLTMFNLKKGTHYRYNGSNNILTFFNGSQILLKDLFTYPSDPNFDSLGGIELTLAFVDEANQISEKAKNVLISRVGRCKNVQYNIKPKTLYTCNPAMGWVYEEFYMPHRNGNLKPYRFFLQSLVTDNPYIGQSYKDNLNKLDNVSKQRLLYGKWEYGTELNLFDYEKTIALFKGNYPVIKDNTNNIKYKGTHITCDVARLGRDRTEIFVWNDLELIYMESHQGKRTNETAEKIKNLEKQYGIKRANVVIDTDGIGGGVSDNLPGCKEFHNGARPLNGENYQNLKTQCIFKLAEKLDDISIYNYTPEFKEEMIKTLGVVERTKVDSDGKMQCTDKQAMKELLGKSPDTFDALYMRMLFELKPQLTNKSFSITVLDL